MLINCVLRKHCDTKTTRWGLINSTLFLLLYIYWLHQVCSSWFFIRPIFHFLALQEKLVYFNSTGQNSFCNFTHVWFYSILFFYSVILFLPSVCCSSDFFYISFILVNEIFSSIFAFTIFFSFSFCLSFLSVHFKFGGVALNCCKISLPYINLPHLDYPRSIRDWTGLDLSPLKDKFLWNGFDNDRLVSLECTFLDIWSEWMLKLIEEY